MSGKGKRFARRLTQMGADGGELLPRTTILFIGVHLRYLRATFFYSNNSKGGTISTPTVGTSELPRLQALESNPGTQVHRTMRALQPPL